jgi:hypothetical protein
MIKFTSNNDFDFQVESVTLLRDISKDLTKRASAKEFLKISKTKGQEDLHVIALGSYEGTGFNRNGDAFTEEDCKKNHHYFTRANRAVHRHHKNKPQDPKFGNIKAAAYNDAMRRIELVVGLDIDKCADILHEQETTGNTNWSMASKQAYDTCSWCHHKAVTDKDRCEHIPKKIGEINKHGEMCGMMNPDPRWFEISYVRRPADRIGMSLGKVASAGGFSPMLPRDFLNIYGDIYVPEYLGISKKAADKRNILHKLSEMEKYVDGVTQGQGNSAKDQFVRRYGSRIDNNEAVSSDSMDELRKLEPSQVLKALADHGIVFSPEDFAKYLFENRVDDGHVKGMKSHLSNVYSEADKNNDGYVTNNELYDVNDSAPASPQAKNIAKGLHNDHSLFGGPSIRRAMHNVASDKPHHGFHGKVAQSNDSVDLELAKQYAAYKLAALNYLNEQGKLDEDILLNAVLQNRR